MKNFLLGLLLSLGGTLLPLPLLARDAPLEVGGIALGSSIDTYPDIIQSNFLKEVVVTNRHGFRKGIISSGVCKYEGEILKIKLKYEDKSKSFYKTLLKKYRAEYGAPDSWKGDSFGMLHAWSWSFTDKNGARVSLTLQYNAKDPNQTIGNTVKLSYPDRVEEERNCFMQMCNRASKQTDAKQREELKKADWSYLIPH
ncbi:MAG: hypothetical protein JRJ68_02665 [Deltaproteobacteria bacterium]|nr:hypothetical protein [Deltaproteobacteria bacterium]